MPPVILTLLQGLFLLLLYVFVARAVRAVLRDVTASGPGRVPARTARRQARRQAPPRRRQAVGQIVVHPPDQSPHAYPLDGGAITLGRASDVTIFLDDPYVSDHHARLYREGDGWYVADEGSTNGTYLNQQKVTTPQPLSPGDQVSVGKTLIEVRK